MIELIERFESFTSSVTKAYKSIQKIKIAEAEQIGLKPSHVMYMYYLGKNLEGLTHTAALSSIHSLHSSACVSPSKFFPR